MDEILTIAQPQLARQDFELHARGNKIASITCHNEFRHLYCIADISADKFRLEKIGLLRPRIIVKREGSTDVIGQYTYGKFGRPSTALINGQAFQIHSTRSGLWGTRYEWENSLGETVISFAISTIKPISEISIKKDIYDSQDGPLIAALAFYDRKTRADRFA